MDIFVSYTTRDYYIDRELLERMSEILSNYGNCYIDLLHNNAIHNKQQYVEQMLSQAKLLLLISSDSIDKSEWVQWELCEAERRHIPIIVIQAKPDLNETLNNLKSKLASIMQVNYHCFRTIAVSFSIQLINN